ncbi:MAG: PilZ domain-containing protein [Proteobacteria bacterium]|nr:PilZ domain-containing protein [Pseudomonadota bacterium]MBU4463651.1 PilZ domain-containing protein [Pseudomonadota bacterium]
MCVNAFSSNISGSGIFIKTAKPLAKGEPFLLKLKLPDSSEELMIKCARRQREQMKNRGSIQTR